jgi:hypothetical protein
VLGWLIIDLRLVAENLCQLSVSLLLIIIVICHNNLTMLYGYESNGSAWRGWRDAGDWSPRPRYHTATALAPSWSRRLAEESWWLKAKWLAMAMKPRARNCETGGGTLAGAARPGGGTLAWRTPAQRACEERKMKWYYGREMVLTA